MYNNDVPKFIIDYLIYMNTIKGRSEKTVLGYYYDLRTFLRFLTVKNEPNFKKIKLDEVDVSDRKSVV